jgi:hypothetical protein
MGMKKMGTRMCLTVIDTNQVSVNNMRITCDDGYRTYKHTDHASCETWKNEKTKLLVLSSIRTNKMIHFQSTPVCTQFSGRGQKIFPSTAQTLLDDHQRHPRKRIHVQFHTVVNFFVESSLRNRPTTLPRVPENQIDNDTATYLPGVLPLPMSLRGDDGKMIY